MSPVEVWSNSEDESPEHDSGSNEHQHQLGLQEQQQFRQSRRLQMDTMQDIICDDTDRVRYVCVKSDENNGGGNHNNNNNNGSHISNNNGGGLTSSSSGCSSNGNGGSNNGGLPMDKDEKRMRREIANSNERRRMQSINAGFQSLRQMLPHHEGEKLSKAAILQQTAEYIYSLEQEKTRLLSQNCQLKRLLDQQDHNGAGAGPDAGTPPVSQTQTQIAAGVGGTTTTQIPVGGGVGAPTGGVVTGGTTNLVATTVAKKRKIDSVPVSDSSDEGLGSMSPEPVTLRTNGGFTPIPTPTTTITATNNPPATGTTTTSNGRQCTTVNFSVKDFLELKHQLDVERRQRSSVEDKLKSLERQLAYPVVSATRLHQFHPDGPELVVSASDCLIEQQPAPPPPAEEVAVSIIHKSTIAPAGGKVARVGPAVAELVDGGSAVQVIALESSGGMLGAKKHQLLVATAADVRLEEALAVPQQQQQQVYIKRARSRSPAGETTTTTTTTVVTLPPKKHRYPSILEAAIKAEPKVEVERISSPSSIVVNEEHMMVTTTGAHLVGAGPKLTATVQQQQQPPRLNTCRHNLETIVEAIRHLEGDAFDAVVPTQQQQQQHQHPPALQPLQPPQPHSTSSTPAAAQQAQAIGGGGGHRPMQEVPLALTTSSKQQQQQAIQSKHDRDHRQSQLEPYLKFRTGAGGVLPTVSTVVATATNNLLPIAGSGSGVVTVAPPAAAASSIISVSLASAATTIVANGTAASPATTVPLPAATLHHPHLTPATAAQILQQQQQCRPGVIVVKQNT
ncbi:uncharacterized protein LOC128271054 [Anopheles cruzii]|uniref:uncharacterized protein LOC128271054 n=1 Tax=Anopheles cruzii TaxID=68878 RepID=UPI0022EC3EDA|nr:uncharacterized protein LOC128271054 [Anopheles cruzii]